MNYNRYYGYDYRAYQFEHALLMFMNLIFTHPIEMCAFIVSLFPFVLEVEALSKLETWYPDYYEMYNYQIIYKRTYIHYILGVLLFVLNYISIYLVGILCAKLISKFFAFIYNKITNNTMDDLESSDFVKRNKRKYKNTNKSN
jgi:hypothetical protein